MKAGDGSEGRKKKLVELALGEPVSSISKEHRTIREKKSFFESKTRKRAKILLETFLLC
tara:strand:- start:621 stop:797 length:177 start_codon:yes stop_codon:yes gene_type:complete